nr:hypothetical protein [Saccharopolyspora sp. HNM0983]
MTAGGNNARRVAVAAAAVPVMLIALAMPANAVEIAPIAEVLDSLLADVLSTVGAVLDALGLAA